MLPDITMNRDEHIRQALTPRAGCYIEINNPDKVAAIPKSKAFFSLSVSRGYYEFWVQCVCEQCHVMWDPPLFSIYISFWGRKSCSQHVDCCAHYMYKRFDNHAGTVCICRRPIPKVDSSLSLLLFLFCTRTKRKKSGLKTESTNRVLSNSSILMVIIM